jgi:predicted RNA methylase
MFMSGKLKVPFVPTPEPVVKRMLAVADLKPGELVYDLGAGDGRILSSAVKDFGAKAIGVELHESRYEAIVKRLERERLRGSAGVVRGDFFDINLSQADVVTLYLLASVNSMVKPKLERELKAGARVVSHDFPIHGWVPVCVEKVTDRYNTHLVYLYKVPNSVKHRSALSSSISRALSGLANSGRLS